MMNMILNLRKRLFLIFFVPVLVPAPVLVSGVPMLYEYQLTPEVKSRDVFFKEATNSLINYDIVNSTFSTNVFDDNLTVFEKSKSPDYVKDPLPVLLKKISRIYYNYIRTDGGVRIMEILIKMINEYTDRTVLEGVDPHSYFTDSNLEFTLIDTDEKFSDCLIYKMLKGVTEFPLHVLNNKRVTVLNLVSLDLQWNDKNPVIHGTIDHTINGKFTYLNITFLNFNYVFDLTKMTMDLLSPFLNFLFCDGYIVKNVFSANLFF